MATPVWGNGSTDWQLSNGPTWSDDCASWLTGYPDAAFGEGITLSIKEGGVARVGYQPTSMTITGTGLGDYLVNVSMSEISVSNSIAAEDEIYYDSVAPLPIVSSTAVAGGVDTYVIVFDWTGFGANSGVTGLVFGNVGTLFSPPLQICSITFTEADAEPVSNCFWTTKVHCTEVCD